MNAGQTCLTMYGDTRLGTTADNTTVQIYYNWKSSETMIIEKGIKGNTRLGFFGTKF